MKSSSFAPGRVRLLGHPSSSHRGAELSATIELGVTARGSARQDERIILSSNGNHDATYFGDPIFIERRGRWADYPLGVTKTLALCGHQLRGFDFHFESSLPPGVGLSSTSAMEVATLALLRKIFRLDIDPMDLARICNETRKESKITDDRAAAPILFGKRGHAVLTDGGGEDVTSVPIGADVGVLLMQVGSHSSNPSTSATVDPPQAAPCPSESILKAAELLRMGDLPAFGRIMSASHCPSSVPPKVDQLVQIALATAGVFGARAATGRAGSTVIALVPSGQSAEISRTIAEKYIFATSLTPKIVACTIGDGAVLKNS
jgi:galactokinase